MFAQFQWRKLAKPLKRGNYTYNYQFISIVKKDECEHFIDNALHLYCSLSKSKSAISTLFSLTAKVYLLTLGILTATSRMGCSNTERLSLTSRLMNGFVLCRNRLEATRISSVSKVKKEFVFYKAISINT